MMNALSDSKSSVVFSSKEKMIRDHNRKLWSWNNHKFIFAALQLKLPRIKIRNPSKLSMEGREEHIQNVIDQLKSFDFDSVDLDFIQRIILSLGKSMPSIKSELKAGTKVFRCRKLNRPMEAFAFPQNISYRSDLQNINNLGRANVHHSSKFYGSIRTEDVDAGYFTALAETSLLMRRIGNDALRYNGMETYQVGMWETTADMSTLLITQHPEKAKLSKASSEHSDYFENACKEFKITDTQKQLVYFLADEFSKVVYNGDSHQYAISAVFSEIVLQHDEIQAIGYPSVQTESKGFNVVFNPHIADSFLKPIAFGVYNIISVDNETFMFPNGVEAEARDGFPLRWKESASIERININEILWYFDSRGISERKVMEVLLINQLNSGPFLVEKN